MTSSPPTVEDLKSRYPAFDAVADATVKVWLDEGALDLAGWSDETRDRANLLYAAHRLSESGQGTGAIPAGVTSFKSGTFSASLSDTQASRTGFNTTVYGRELLQLARRNYAGPRLAWTPPVSV